MSKRKEVHNVGLSSKELNEILNGSTLIYQVITKSKKETTIIYLDDADEYADEGENND